MKIREKRGVVWKMSNDNFRDMVEKSVSVGDICQQLSSRKGGSIFANIRQRIGMMGLNTKHFVDGRTGKYSPTHVSKTEFLVRIKNRVKMDPKWLKKKLIEFSIFPDKCNECSLSGTWNDKPLTLHLDHIDGDYENCWLNNLRLLCPNCHSQTSTYGVGKRRRKVYVCQDCRKNTSGYSIRCPKCACIEREKQKKMVGNNGIEPLNQECHSCSLPLA